MTASFKESVSIGKGRYFHVEVRPKTEFDAFYTEDVGRRKHSMLVLGRRKVDQKWVTHKWLISKEDAYISEGGKLKSEDYRVQQIIDYVDGDLVHKEKDTFCVRPHRNLKQFEASKTICDRDSCPDMYFENYEDYEKYQEERLNNPMIFE